jgi:hypothetical protein
VSCGQAGWHIEGVSWQQGDVGGSFVGLASTLFLAWQDVPVMMVERNPGSSPRLGAVIPDSHDIMFANQMMIDREQEITRRSAHGSRLTHHVL